MTRLDRLILGRLAVTFSTVLAVIFGLVVLAELLQPSRYLVLWAAGGPAQALAGLAARAGRWAIDTLPLTVLISTIAALLLLEGSRELTIVKAAGHSVWRVMRAPVVASLALGVVAAGVVQPLVTATDRALTTGAGPGRSGAFWIEEKGPTIDYVLGADAVEPGGTALKDVSIYGLEDGTRLVARSATLASGSWTLEDVTRYRSGRPAEHFARMDLEATTRPGDIAARLGVLDDLTIYELGSVVLSRISDPVQRARTLTRLTRLLVLPLSLAVSIVIAFAFTAGYRRMNRYGSEMLYGIVVGFVVYVVSELAGRAGYAGVIPPLAAVLAPALIALIAGMTILLFREDGLR